MKIIMKLSEKEMNRIKEVYDECSIIPMDDTCFNHKVHMKYGEISMDSDGSGYIEINIGERTVMFFMNKYSTAISLLKNIAGLVKTFCKELIDDIKAILITDEEPEMTIDDMTMEEYVDMKMKSTFIDDNDDEENDVLLIYKLHEYMQGHHADISPISEHGVYNSNNAINFHGDDFHVFQVFGDDFVYIVCRELLNNNKSSDDKTAKSVEEALSIIGRE